MLRKLRFFSDQIVKAELVAVPRPPRDKAYELDELEVKLEELERELLEVNANVEKLRRSHSELVELQLVLEKAGSFFDAARSDAGLHASDFSTSRSASASASSPMLGGEGGGEGGAAGGVTGGGASKAVRLGFITGVVPSERTEAFERVLFRATRGNMFLKQAPIEGKVEDPASGDKVLKTVYVVFFAGERARAKILKICEAFGANRYPFPEDAARQRAMNAEVTARLRELHATLEASSKHRDGTLESVGYSLAAWMQLVRREKAVYHTLNCLSIDVTRKCLVAEGWCPVVAKARVQAVLVAAAQASSAQVGTVFQPLSTAEMPPTYFVTNKVTSVFQTIVDAYGVASYREANPTVFTIVTFPFLFAVMFGDLGHALLMLLFAVYLIRNEKVLGASPQGEIFGMAFGGRYCILLMSIFSLYTGLLYNEFFSVPMVFAGQSTFVCHSNPTGGPDTWDACPEATKTGLVPTGTYGFGADPVWHGTRSELPFFNSVKMKMSVIMGVIQMFLGIGMSYLNHRHFKDKLSIICEFVPQVLFLGSIFGYLCLLMVIKWTTPGCVADLYHIMIYMFLAPGNVDCTDAVTGIAGCPENVILGSAGGQAFFQNLLLLIAFVCVPWMLIPKPYILKKRHEESLKHGGGGGGHGRAAGDGDGETLLGDEAGSHEHGGAVSLAPAAGGGGGGGGHGHGDHFDFSEVMVHQMIHTIEFVLGAISNTASYLRLWALSLAHAQLSAVFYDKVLMAGVASGNAIALTIAFFVWASATLGVLMIMETLSAFLHALRLHWVEFMNKFFRCEILGSVRIRCEVLGGSVRLRADARKPCVF
jgi:V-type H+-transporting ATPase subunit a